MHLDDSDVQHLPEFHATEGDFDGGLRKDATSERVEIVSPPGKVRIDDILTNDCLLFQFRVLKFVKH